MVLAHYTVKPHLLTKRKTSGENPMPNRMRQAMAVAEEYRRMVDAGRTAEAAQCRRMIETLVGYFVDGRLEIPQVVWTVMGEP